MKSFVSYLLVCFVGWIIVRGELGKYAAFVSQWSWQSVSLTSLFAGTALVPSQGGGILNELEGLAVTGVEAYATGGASLAVQGALSASGSGGGLAIEGAAIG